MYEYPHQLVTSYWRRGVDGRYWYDQAVDGLGRWFPDPCERSLFIGFLAATSQNTNASGNITQALKALRQYETGKDFSGFLPTVYDNLKRVAGGDEPRGPKINAFYRALHGDESAVTVDIWMARAYGFKPQNLTPKRMRFIQENVTERAARMGWTPRNYQAAIWNGVKSVLDPYTLDNRPYSQQLADRLA